jgi:hypothetical protein
MVRPVKTEATFAVRARHGSGEEEADEKAAQKSDWTSWRLHRFLFVPGTALLRASFIPESPNAT